MSHFINSNSKRMLNNSSTSLSSLASSFSDASWDTCSMADTPISNHDTSFESCMSDTSTFTNPFPLINVNNQETMNMSFNNNHLSHSTSMMSFDCSLAYAPVEDVFVSHHGLPTPPIDMSSYSPVHFSHTSGYVAPSETTFGQFDAQSPIRTQNSLNLHVGYSSPAADYRSEYSFDGMSSQCFDDSFRSSMTPASSVASTPARTSISRSIKMEALPSSAALQSIQSLQTNASRKKAKTERRLKRSSSNSSRTKSICGEIPSNIKCYPQGGYDCSFPGCNKKFQRTEHCKRHENTVHKNERFPCLFCKPGKEKTFQPKRMDNYRTHLDLHLKNTPRTFYNPAAAAEIARLDALKKGKKCGKSANEFDDVGDMNEISQNINCKL